MSKDQKDDEIYILLPDGSCIPAVAIKAEPKKEPTYRMLAEGLRLGLKVMGDRK